MQQLFINEFINVTNYGASCPVIIKADDNNTYVLKTRYQSNLDLDNNGVAQALKDSSIYIETLSYLLLQEVGFTHIPKIVYIEIDDDAIEDAKSRFGNSSHKRDKMALENIQNSKGLNLGVKWIADSEGAFNKLEMIPKNIREMAINYDAYVMNVDRHKSNPNILFTKKNNKFYLIDFGNAFDSLTVFESLYEDDDILKIGMLFDKYMFDKYYLFFNEIHNMIKYKKRFSKDDILNIIKVIPLEWKPNILNEAISIILSNRIGNKEIFEDA